MSETTVTTEAPDTWARTILEQIGTGALMNLGARDMVRDDARRTLMMRVGSGRVLRKAIVHLNAWDLYDVRIVRITRPAYEVIIEAEYANVYADQLAELLLTAHGRVTS